MLLDDLVMAHKILFREGVVDAFGHVGVRDPDDAGRFLMARSMPPPFVTREDILLFDLEGRKIGGRAGEASIERFIYAGIFRARPEVLAIVHSHAETVLPFTVAAGTPLRALTHNGGMLGAGAPLFEIRDYAGEDSNMLVGDRKLGEALAAALGSHTVVLMRGHGFTVVGGSLKEAVYHAVHTVAAARVQLDAIRLGNLSPLSPGEAAATSRIHRTVLDRYWDVWAARALGRLP